MTTRSPDPGEPAGRGEGPDSAWEHLTHVQADAVRATAALTIRHPDQLADELIPLLYIPPASDEHPAAAS